MHKRILVPLALLALTALTLTACGGGGSEAEGKITETIETAATTSNPKNCTELQTLRFNEQNSTTKGKGATEVCEEEAGKGEEQAKAAKVSNVSVNGSKATAEVEFEGGSLASQTLEVALVEEEGQWKLDQIEGFAKYDGKAIAKAFQKQFEESPEGLTQKQTTCIAEGLANANKAEGEELLLGGSSTPIEELAKGCA